MRKGLRFPIPILVAGALLPLAPAQDLTELLDELREQYDVPALGAVELRGGKVTAIGAVGLRKRGAKAVVTTKDLWHLGSCTKAMTSTLVGVLVEKGTLSWDTTLADGFPGIDVHEDIVDVTVRQLLAHRSGLMANPMIKDLWKRLVEYDGSTRAAREMIVREVLTLRPAVEAETHYLYSNTGYVTIGALIERKTGKSWEKLIRKLVWKPLGMKSAGFGPPGRKGKITQPRAHSAQGTAIEPGPGADNPAALGPAGTVHATLRDWAKFIALHLRGARGESGLLLKPETFAVLHKPLGRKGDYALGWIIMKQPWSEGPVLWHNGSNTMWYAVVWAAPAEDFAVLVTCNQGGPKAQQACDAVAKRLFPPPRGKADDKAKKDG